MVDSYMDNEGKPKTARSYRGAVVDDNAIISINIKWLIQMLVVVASIVYGYVRIEMRIGDLESGLVSADTEIKQLLEAHEAEQEEAMATLQEEVQWYQKEFNLNPLSWKRKKRK